MCLCKCVNHVFNSLVEKIMDDLGLNFFPQRSLLEKNIEISMWELNKVHNMGVQSLSDKKNKGFVLNQLKSFTMGSLVHPHTLGIFLLYS